MHVHAGRCFGHQGAEVRLQAGRPKIEAVQMAGVLHVTPWGSYGLEGGSTVRGCLN